MILVGDCLERMRELPELSVQTCVTSPPYWGLRDYGVDGQLGLEKTPDEYVSKMVEVFREVRRVLKDDGTLWLNLGDSYAAANPSGKQGKSGDRASRTFTAQTTIKMAPGLKPKDLVGIPWRVAFALQADGWYLRQDIIWHKPNPMPESVRDRCTKAHEYIFLLSKSERYLFDVDAIKEPMKASSVERQTRPWNGERQRAMPDNYRPHSMSHYGKECSGMRNRRSVWSVTTKSFKGAHFATFPPDLIEPCILAGSRKGDTVLDPFAGAGTTWLVSRKHGREFIGCELNQDYASMAERRVDYHIPKQESLEASL